MSVRVTTFDTLDEAFTKLSTGKLEFDVIFTSPDHITQLVGRKLIQPLNFDLIPNLVKNAWPELHSPFYDVGPRYTIPYTVYTTGIGWRNDKLGDFDPAQLGWDVAVGGASSSRAAWACSTTRARGSGWRSCAAA